MIERTDIDAAVLGGAVLGGGGGGLPSVGRRLGHLACEVGRPRLIGLEELSDDHYVVCVAAVGAPAAEGSVPRLGDFARAVSNLVAQAGLPIRALVTNENGALSTLNALLASALSGLPAVDLAANGRAHPTTLMGAMGLERQPGYRAVQAVVGGGDGLPLEMVVSGSLDHCGKMVRRAAVLADGLVAVARNPVSVDHARRAGVPGAISEAIRIGRAMLEARDGGAEAVRAAAREAARMDRIAAGTVAEVRLRTADGFDSGAVSIAASDGRELEVTFMNEFITLDAGPERIATFPDLIVLFDWESGLPLSSAEVKAGQKVEVAVAPAAHIGLGEGMRNPELFRVVEQAVGRPVISYAFHS